MIGDVALSIISANSASEGTMDAVCNGIWAGGLFCSVVNLEWTMASVCIRVWAGGKFCSVASLWIKGVV